MSPIGANKILGIYTIPIVALCVQPTCVLHCGMQYHMLCYALHSQHDPYTPPHQTGRIPVDNQIHQDIPSPLGAWLFTRTYLRHNRQDFWRPRYMLGRALSLCISSH